MFNPAVSSAVTALQTEWNNLELGWPQGKPQGLVVFVSTLKAVTSLDEKDLKKVNFFVQSIKC